MLDSGQDSWQVRSLFCGWDAKDIPEVAVSHSACQAASFFSRGVWSEETFPSASRSQVGREADDDSSESRKQCDFLLNDGKNLEALTEFYNERRDHRHVFSHFSSDLGLMKGTFDIGQSALHWNCDSKRRRIAGNAFMCTHSCGTSCSWPSSLLFSVLSNGGSLSSWRGRPLSFKN